MKNFLSIFLFSCLFFTVKAQQRNVILIIADDLGSDYCGFSENRLDTAKMPNVRRLLARGVRFRNAWANPLCSPTRAGMLTGRYSFRTGVGDVASAAVSLDTAELTIPKLLNRYKPNGIAKGHIGKWHLQQPIAANYSNPNKMGYDHYEGNMAGMVASYTNWTKVTNGVAATITNYATTETVNNALAWLKNQDASKPFFLWLAFNTPHSPFHLPPANLHSSTNLSGTAADITANPKPYFKAMIEAMDTEIGRLFDSLQIQQKWDNTDIIFIGDNGNESATAQRTGGAKGGITEQGISVPFIISGPSVVNPNRVSNAMVHTTDLFATILDLFGYTTWQSQIAANKPVDSKSIVPILKNQATEIRTWNFDEVFRVPTVGGDGKTMRNASYKLINLDNGTQRFYKIDTDTLETTNLLTRTLTATETTNYNFLCNQMTTLVGTGRFCTLTPTQDLNNPDNLSVYPNPFVDFIKIKNTLGTETYHLYNALGQVYFKGKNIQNQNFSALPKGVYFLEVLDKNKTVLKLVKG